MLQSLWGDNNSSASSRKTPVSRPERAASAAVRTTAWSSTDSAKKLLPCATMSRLLANGLPARASLPTQSVGRYFHSHR